MRATSNSLWKLNSTNEKQLKAFFCVKTKPVLGKIQNQWWFEIGFSFYLGINRIPWLIVDIPLLRSHN